MTERESIPNNGRNTKAPGPSVVSHSRAICRRHASTDLGQTTCVSESQSGDARHGQTFIFSCLFLLSCARHLPVWRTLEEASSTSARVSRPVPPLRVGRNAADDCFEDGSCQRRRVDNFSAARRESEPCEDLRWCSRLRMELTSWSVSGRTGKQTHAEVFSPKQAFKYGGVLSLWP